MAIRIKKAQQGATSEVGRFYYYHLVLSTSHCTRPAIAVMSPVGCRQLCFASCTSSRASWFPLQAGDSQGRARNNNLFLKAVQTPRNPSALWLFVPPCLVARDLSFASCFNDILEFKMRAIWVDTSASERWPKRSSLPTRTTSPRCTLTCWRRRP